MKNYSRLKGVISETYRKFPTISGAAGDFGLKQWWWSDVVVPPGGPGDYSFSGGDLGLAIECNPNLITNYSEKLRFHLNPTTPAPQGWCGNSYNMRAEISTQPFNIDHEAGTEEWFGWSYGLGDGYIVDTFSDIVIFQVHEGTVGESPLISLELKGGNSGEISLVNASQSGTNNTYIPTGVIPVAGQFYDIVIHIIWGEDATGLLELWIDGVSKYSSQTRTVRASDPVGGNAKWGIYYSEWRDSEGVSNSAGIGVTEIETFIGPLKMYTIAPNDPTNGNDRYNAVKP